jgi:hypothetical protein
MDIEKHRTRLLVLPEETAWIRAGATTRSQR